jgi:hypothetical protein
MIQGPLRLETHGRAAEQKLANMRGPVARF